MSDEALFIGFDHVAYATRDTDATLKVLTALGFELKIYKQVLEKFNAYVTKVVSATNPGHVVEIVEPLGERSSVSALLRENEATIYHSCFRTNDFHRAHAMLKAQGAVTVSKPMKIPYPLTEAHGRFLLSHMFHPHLGLLEITGPVVNAAAGEGH